MKYRSGRIAPTPHGTYRARITINRTRHQKSLKTLQDAKDYIDSLTHNPRTLAIDQYYDALRALEILPPDVTLTEAATAYTPKSGAPQSLTTTADAVRQFIEEKADAGRRPAHLTSLRSLLGKLDPARLIHEWTPDDIARLVKRYTPTTRNNHLRAWHNLFRWAQARGHLDHQPTQSVTRALEIHKPPPILTVDQTRRLLETAAATDPQLVPAIAIAAFAGIRASELRQIHAQDINFEAGHIHISARIAKTRQQRYVEIHPTLRAWLKNYPPDGPVCPHNWRKRITAARTASKIRTWPQNAHRHSYATYHLAAHQNPSLTAHQLGHPNPDLLYKHYRNLVTKHEGAAYFNIQPTRGQNTRTKQKRPRP